MSDSKKETAIEQATMLTVKEVANLLQCCDRHVTNLRNRKEIPQPAKVGGRSVRWPRRQILDWIDAGCPAIAV